MYERDADLGSRYEGIAKRMLKHPLLHADADFAIRKRSRIINVMKKNAAAVTLGRKGGIKGGAARAARMTPEQRSASASKAVRARWEKAGKFVAPPMTEPSDKNSDHQLATLLTRFRVATERAEIQQLSEQIERMIFHKQFENA